MFDISFNVSGNKRRVFGHNKFDAESKKIKDGEPGNRDFMSYKIILSLTFVVVVATIIAVIGQTRQTVSKQNEKRETVAKMPLDKSESNPVADKADDEFKGEKIVKTEEEWRKILTPEQFHVLREKGTDRAFTGEYTDNHEQGEYYCAACHLKLFNSDAKFESGTGWASFYQPIVTANVAEETDTSYGMTRTEVMCARCGGHLSHVFDDGPKPTGLRYCMNSVALKFEKGK